MKKIIKLTMGLLCMGSMLFYVGCSSDDDDSSNPTATPLEGTLWTETAYSRSGCTNAADNETGVSTCTATECYTVRLSGGTITFTNKEGGVETTDVGTYVIAGNTVTVTAGTDTIVATYVISGTTLTITIIDDGDGCTVVNTYSA